MRTALVCLSLLLPTATQAQAIDVPSDPRARYEAIIVSQLRPGTVEILTRRNGPSGRSYTLREIDCGAQTFRYLGEGDSRSDAEARRSAGSRHGPLTVGSISWHVARYACRR